MDEVTKYSHNQYIHYDLHPDLNKHFYYNYSHFPKNTMKGELTHTDDEPIMRIPIENSNMDIVLKLRNYPLICIDRIIATNSKKFGKYIIDTLAVFAYNYTKYPRNIAKNIWVIPNLILNKDDTLLIFFNNECLKQIWNRYITNTNIINKDIDSLIFLYARLSVSVEILSKRCTSPRIISTNFSMISTYCINEQINDNVVKIYRDLLKSNKIINFMFYVLVDDTIVPLNIFEKLEIFNANYGSLIIEITNDDIGIMSAIKNNHYLIEHPIKEHNKNPLPDMFQMTENPLNKHNSDDQHVYSINLEEIMQDTICMNDHWTDCEKICSDRINFVFYTMKTMQSQVRLFLQF